MAHFKRHVDAYKSLNTCAPLRVGCVLSKYVISKIKKIERRIVSTNNWENESKDQEIKFK